MHAKTLAVVFAAIALITAPAIAIAQPPASVLPVKALGIGTLPDSAPTIARHLLVRRTTELASRAAALNGHHLTHAQRARMMRLTIPGHVRVERRLSREIRRLKAQTHVADAVRGTLTKIAACESGGDYKSNTGNGFYGAYQFDQGTWASVGGSGVASDAPPAEQDMRAAMLLARSGSSPWPVCGR